MKRESLEMFLGTLAGITSDPAVVSKIESLASVEDLFLETEAASSLVTPDTQQLQAALEADLNQLNPIIRNVVEESIRLKTTEMVSFLDKAYGLYQDYLNNREAKMVEVANSELKKLIEPVLTGYNPVLDTEYGIKIRVNKDGSVVVSELKGSPKTGKTRTSSGTPSTGSTLAALTGAKSLTDAYKQVRSKGLFRKADGTEQTAASISAASFLSELKAHPGHEAFAGIDVSFNTTKGVVRYVDGSLIS